LFGVFAAVFHCDICGLKERSPASSTRTVVYSLEKNQKVILHGEWARIGSKAVPVCLMAVPLYLLGGDDNMLKVTWDRIDGNSPEMRIEL
jgi:hypothetical protein